VNKPVALAIRAASFCAATIALCGVATAQAAKPCGLCNTEIVLNSELASCFLAEYQTLSAGDGAAIAVDLSQCGTSRGGLEALPSPDGQELAPDLQFLISRIQLDCLKRKLEEPGLQLDPFTRIELASCG